MINKPLNTEKHSNVSVFSDSYSRRSFLQRMGLVSGGLIVYCMFGELSAQARAPREGFMGAWVPTDFNAFLRIGADNRVTCFVGKIEMGQGPITSFAQMVAEELDVDYESVDMVMGDTDQCPWDAGTWGSFSTRHYGIFITEAAAEAKGVLKEIAAEKLLCPVSRLVTKSGLIYDKNRPMSRVSYGELTAGKLIERHLEKLPDPKPFAEYTISGKPYPRRDAYEKVTGKARFTADIRLPGMLYARILREPAHGAKRTDLDTSAAQKMKDVTVIRDGDMVAVLHPNPDGAAKALAAVKADYSLPTTGINDETIFNYLLKKAPKPMIAGEAGNVQEGEKKSVTVIEKTYYNSYVAHAPMEPHAALAMVENDKITVWASTQTPFGTKDLVAEELGVEKEQIRIIAPFLGGGFGGKAASQQAVEAARIARQAGKPVMLIWTREEEFFFDTFRPAAIVNIRSGIDGNGNMTFWDYHVYFAGSRGCDLYYEIPHHRESVYGEWHMGPGIHPFPVGPWRAPGANTNIYARDLHMNIMASEAGKDPLEFRLAHLKDRRMRRVLEAAAQKFGWSSIHTPSGKGWGISCGIDAETYVAAMAEVDVNRATGEIAVKRVVCAQDMGRVVNPQGATIQMEGCITMGLGYALKEEIHFDSGRILDTNFDTYTLPRFSWLPKIETIIVQNPKLAPKGGGEPAIICMGGVLATAVYDATGAIPHQLPMIPDRIKKALKTA